MKPQAALHVALLPTPASPPSPAPEGRNRDWKVVCAMPGSDPVWQLTSAPPDCLGKWGLAVLGNRDRPVFTGAALREEGPEFPSGRRLSPGYLPCLHGPRWLQPSPQEKEPISFSFKGTGAKKSTLLQFVPLGGRLGSAGFTASGHEPCRTLLLWSGGRILGAERRTNPSGLGIIHQVFSGESGTLK